MMFNAEIIWANLSLLAAPVIMPINNKNKKISKNASKEISKRIKNNIVIAKKHPAQKQKLYTFDDIAHHDLSDDEDVTGITTAKEEFHELLDEDFTKFELYSTDDDSAHELLDSETQDEDRMDDILATYSGLDLSSDEKI